MVFLTIWVDSDSLSSTQHLQEAAWSSKRAKKQQHATAPSASASSSAADSSGTGRMHTEEHREPPYFMDEEGHVWKQSIVNGPTTYLGGLD